MRRPTAVLLALVVGVLAAGCAGGPSSSARPCPPEPPADVGTAPGWVGHLAARPADAAWVVDDGHGTRIAHRADAIMPMASAGKALISVAYAGAVARGAVRADERVRVGDWERWSVAGTEASHVAALDDLRIAHDATHASDPNRTVSLDEIATTMSVRSDDAAPDLLRDRIGDRAILDAGRDVGWTDPELPSTTGFVVSLYTPELVPPATDRPARRAAEWALARRYATDPAFRADADHRPAAPPDVQRAWAAGGPGGTAAELAALWSAVARGGFPGADRARALAEQGPSSYPGEIARGTKRGSLAGVATGGLEVRRRDGTTATSVLLVGGLSLEDTRRIGEDNQGFVGLLKGAVRDPALTAALRCLG